MILALVELRNRVGSGTSPGKEYMCTRLEIFYQDKDRKVGIRFWYHSAFTNSLSLDNLKWFSIRNLRLILIIFWRDHFLMSRKYVNIDIELVKF